MMKMADQHQPPPQPPSSDVVRALVESNDRMTREMDRLQRRLGALEATGGGGGDADSDRAVTTNPPASAAAVGARRGIQWRDSMGGGVADNEDAVGGGGDGEEGGVPMRRIKFRSSDSSAAPQPPTAALPGEDGQPLPLLADGDASDDDSASSASSSSSDAVAFAGWARCFFQARHHRSATQITSGASSTPSQATYLHLTVPSTSNELRISDTDDHGRPPLVDPPIPLRYFYAAKVPGSHSGAALFLKNDSRRLRKYIFRFEFVNRSVRQPPARYLHFVRSGKAAKKSMRGINKMKTALHRRGEDKREFAREDKRRAQDAFAAHLGTLDELLRESDEAAERFVEGVNSRNEAEEDLAAVGSSAAVGEGGRRRRTRPPPPYWGSGFNRPTARDNDGDDDEDDEGVDSDSDYSEEEDELYYDDDNDDETFFDKVQVSTEQTLETLFNHIVK